MATAETRTSLYPELTTPDYSVNWLEVVKCSFGVVVLAVAVSIPGKTVLNWADTHGEMRNVSVEKTGQLRPDLSTMDQVGPGVHPKNTPPQYPKPTNTDLPSFTELNNLRSKVMLGRAIDISDYQQTTGQNPPNGSQPQGQAG